MTWRRLLLALASVVLLVLLQVPKTVNAISGPDTGPYILQVDVYRHLLEIDDTLVLGRYNWPYDIGPPDTAPTETIAQSVFARLLNGSTEVARSVLPWYYRRGWGYGSFSMYLDAVQSAGLWDAGLAVELLGSPTLEWVGGKNPMASTGVLNWHATTASITTQLLVYNNLISWASTLGDYWNAALVTEYVGGNKLSSYGEIYFTSVIPDLRTMVPQLFSGSLEVTEYTDVEYPQTGIEAAKAAWPFDFGGISQYVGLPSNDEVLRTLLAFMIIFVVCAELVRRNVPSLYALFAGYALLFVLAVPGFVSLVIVGGSAFLVVLLTGMVFVLRRS